MIITSHWPEVMKKLSDHVIWLEKGEIIEEGNPAIIVTEIHGSSTSTRKTRCN